MLNLKMRKSEHVISYSCPNYLWLITIMFFCYNLISWRFHDSSFLIIVTIPRVSFLETEWNNDEIQLLTFLPSLCVPVSCFQFESSEFHWRRLQYTVAFQMTRAKRQFSPKIGRISQMTFQASFVCEWNVEERWVLFAWQ